MTEAERQEILTRLDYERRNSDYPGVVRFSEQGVVRDVATNGKTAQIAYTSCSDREIDSIIQREIDKARSAGYELEWKVFGHDRPHVLVERLIAAGFEAEDQEMFMVLRASEEALAPFGVIDADIRQVTDRQGLEGYRIVMEEVRGRNCDSEMEEYADVLENHPSSMSLYVAYVDEEPAACGRIYCQNESYFGALYGGQTRERFRKRGLFTQVVATRIQEALRRGVTYLCVDALPTSEPILKKRGFEIVTFTQPFLFTP